MGAGRGSTQEPDPGTQKSKQHKAEQATTQKHGSETIEAGQHEEGTYTHTNTHKHTDTNTQTHKHTQTHTNTQTQTHTHTYLRMRMRDAAWGERGCFEGRGGKIGGERRTGRLVSQAMRAASMDPQEERCTQLYQCIQGHTKGRGEQGFAKLQLSVLNLCVCVWLHFF